MPCYLEGTAAGSGRGRMLAGRCQPIFLEGLGSGQLLFGQRVVNHLGAHWFERELGVTRVYSKGRCIGYPSGQFCRCVYCSAKLLAVLRYGAQYNSSARRGSRHLMLIADSDRRTGSMEAWALRGAVPDSGAFHAGVEHVASFQYR